MRPFCKLADPANYVAAPWDLSTDTKLRRHFVAFFKSQYNTMLKVGIDSAAAHGGNRDEATNRADRARGEFFSRLDDFEAHPSRYGRVTFLVIDEWRDSALRRNGFDDPYIDFKNQATETAMAHLPQVCRQIDQLRGEAQLQAVVKGVFAGNVFDMGVEAMAKKMLGGTLDFFATREGISPRPWLMDDYDALAARFLRGPIHRKAVYFVDNAGGDFVLGAVPMVRWMAMRGTRVVIAANRLPTLNDVSISDVKRWWPQLVQVEPSLADLPIELVSTGTVEPLIDLGAVSEELNAAAADADLVILEGMGRAVESNLDARFACDVLKVAMIKEEVVAESLGGKTLDVVCRFEAFPAV